MDGEVGGHRGKYTFLWPCIYSRSVLSCVGVGKGIWACRALSLRDMILSYQHHVLTAVHHTHFNYLIWSQVYGLQEDLVYAGSESQHVGRNVLFN